MKKNFLFILLIFILAQFNLFAVFPTLNSLEKEKNFIEQELPNKTNGVLDVIKQPLKKNSSVNYTLSKVLQLSYSNNFLLKKDIYESQIEKMNYDVERSEYLPDFRTEISYSKDSNSDVDSSLGGAAGGVTQPVGFGTGYNVSFISEYVIWNGGYHRNKANQTKIKTNLKNVVYKSDKYELQFDVIKAYYDYILFSELVKLRRSLLDYSQENLRFTISQINKGVEIKSALYKAENDLQQVQYDLENELYNLELSRSILNSYIGNAPERIISLNSDFLKVPEKLDYKVSQLLKIGLNNRIELKKLDVQKKIAVYDNKIAKSTYFRPKIKTQGLYGFLNEDKFSLNSRDETWKAKIIAELYLFEGWKKKTQIKQSDLGIKKIVNQRKHSEFQIKLEIRRMFNDYIHKMKKLKMTTNKINQAEEELKVQKVNFDKGVVVYKDYLASKKTVLLNKFEFIESLYNYTMAYFNLKKALGLDYNIEIIKK